MALFESAHAFRSAEAPGAVPEGSPRGARAGRRAPPPRGAAHRGGPRRLAQHARPADFYAARPLVDAVLAAAGVEWSPEPGRRPFLHPGRAAVILAGGRELGWIGELHPLVARAWELADPVAAFELDVDALAELAAGATSTYSDLTSFPAVLQDIAVVVPEDVAAAQVESAVRRAAASCSSACGCSTSTAASRSATAASRWRCGWSSARPTARSPTRRWRSAERRSRPRWRSSGAGSVARVAVVGASGFAGALCAALVARHPSLELTAVTARSDAGRRLDELYPRYGVELTLEELDADRVAERADAALVAYPHGAAAPVVRELRERGLKVVDLSADFRLGQERYERYYQPHEAPELLDGAVYGLPELHRDEIREAELVAAPGCYPTAALLALAPLRDVMADAVVDAKSGVSGAGREATSTTHFVTVAENVNAYKVEGHRHRAELEQELPDGVPVTFMPHLLPIDQGLLASCYVTTKEPLEAADVERLFADAYADEPFVELGEEPPGTRDVRDTNLCRVHATVEPATGRVLAFAAIDNLWKGAAGQAVQDLNLMLGLPETEGLE